LFEILGIAILVIVGALAIVGGILELFYGEKWK